MNPDERAKYLESDDKFSSVHSDSAQEGQTDVSDNNLKDSN
jgi:hypothetical protein